MNLFKSTKAITYISSRGDKVYPIIMDIKTGIVEGDAVFTTGDIDTAYLYTTILEEQSDYNILGSTVICNIQRPDGTTMKVQGDVLGNNLIEFPLGQSGVSQEGIYNFDIAVVFSEKKMVTSPTAQYSVTQSIEVIGEIEEDDRFPILESLISELKIIKDEELVRVSNEEDRLANETVRQNQEVIRKNQEQARVTAEGNRVTSENVRVSAEQARVLKEQERQAIEVERQNSESTREQQEATRVSQENARKQADILRQQEHESRQQLLNGFEGKINTVVDDVAGMKDDVVSVREANKRQDIFLQGLYNENLDGRVTVKEEGSVISLTNSDNGLVDIIGLEGNTLVNYCQDGATELTLNNEINEEGTDITLSDTVDNGLVDIIAEGNTLVNLCNKNTYNLSTPNYVNRYVKISLLQELNCEKYYTFICEINNINDTLSNVIKLDYRSSTEANATHQYINIYELAKGSGEAIISFKPNFNNGILYIYLTNSNEGTSCTVENVMLLEGDYTSKPIPQYFEGMKSVGECEDNKIEIVSQSKNLFNKEKYSYTDNYFIDVDGVAKPLNGYIAMNEYMTIKPNTTYTTSNINCVVEYDVNKNITARRLTWDNKVFTSTESTKYIRLQLGSSDNLEHIQIEEGSVATSYVPHTTSTKEITLSEPLRALPNGVKDKVMKIGDKWYVERNCGSVVLNGSSEERWSNTIKYNNNNIGFFQSSSIFPLNVAGSVPLCDKLQTLKGTQGSLTAYNQLIINQNKEYSSSCYVSTNLTTYAEFESWLKANPITVVYELETPIYEELPIDPTVNTYNDITHISNNSTIPCNMTVKNTGYNAIIKPSTQYTVAFDTDKSGEVGINLGGSKVTTNNNVATVTTPSTLVDDTLRLTGKGVKASKVRLLEGDKTNWIPSYFEGMKSSFEDELQEDGTYKMEILSNNKNLLDIDENIEFDVMTIYLDKPLEKGVYSISYEKLSGYKEGMEIVVAFHDNLKVITSFYLNRTSTFNLSGKVDKIHIYSNGHDYVGSKGKFATIDKLQIERGTDVTNYKKRKQNKIQFSSIEPLRGVGDVKDRFVFKDGKLMIERNCGETVLNGSRVDRIVERGQIKCISFLIGVPKMIASLGKNKIASCNDKFNVLTVNQATSKLDSEYIYHNDSSSPQFIISIQKDKILTQDVAGFKQWLSESPITVVYQLAEPTYEEIPHELQKIILEGYKDGTLFFDTNIPPTVEASYTANIPVVSELNKNSNEIGLTQEDLSVTQVAVDFLLMSNIGEEMLSSFNLNTRGRNSMGAYFANRITKGALKYEDVISKYPQYKEEIDSILETK